MAHLCGGVPPCVMPTARPHRRHLRQRTEQGRSMTRPRPPHGGGNQDEPTEMGRTQNLGHRTQNLGAPTARVKASNFSDQQAESLAWSQEEQAGGQPPQDYGAGSYKQYPQYDQPQYQQPQYEQPQYQQPQYAQQPAPAPTGTKMPFGTLAIAGGGVGVCLLRRGVGHKFNRFRP